MQHQALSIRTFIGAKDYEISRSFYKDLGFEEFVVGEKMCLFRIDGLGFYLQDYYAEDWVNNSMVFLEVTNPEAHLEQVKALDLTRKYPNVRFTEVQYNDWGREYFMHDPSGVLWHFGAFV
ncbi:MAG: glyoxalase [Bacteroidota bacterium]